MRIAGPMSVTCLEIMSEINTVAMVVNKHRQLAVIPMDSLTLAMQSTQPSIRPEILPEFGHVHTIKYHQQAGGTGQRYLMISDDTHLYIRKYNATRDIFSQFAVSFRSQRCGKCAPVTTFLIQGLEFCLRTRFPANVF